MMTFDEAIELSGDSTFLGMSYDGRILTIRLVLGESDDDVDLRIPTSIVRTDLPVDDEAMLRTCRICFQRLNVNVQIENNRYVSSLKFPELMKEVRSGRSLAYGMSASDRMGVLSLVGYSQLVTCLVADENDIIVSKVGS